MQAETVHPYPEGLLRGGKAEKMQRDRPADLQTEANPRRQLHSPCSDDANDANESEVEGSGFTFCSSSSSSREGKGGEDGGRGPRQLFFSLLLCSVTNASLPSNTIATPTTSLPRGSCQGGEDRTCQHASG